MSPDSIQRLDETQPRNFYFVSIFITVSIIQMDRLISKFPNQNNKEILKIFHKFGLVLVDIVRIIRWSDSFNFLQVKVSISIGYVNAVCDHIRFIDACNNLTWIAMRQKFSIFDSRSGRDKSEIWWRSNLILLELNHKMASMVSVVLLSLSQWRVL